MSAEDRLLDHEYDGIQEYDNPLPSWWVWVFWATIIFSGAYIMYYHVGIGPTVHDEFEAQAVAILGLGQGIEGLFDQAAQAVRIAELAIDLG